MSKKTLALIIFLFVITCGLLYLALVTTPYPKKEVTNAPTPTPLSVNAHTILTLAPALATESSLLAPSGQAKTAQYTLAVGIDTGGNVVNAVQMELSYDPQALTNVVMTPGKFFQQPSVLVNSLDATDGRMSYALTEQINLPGKKGTGTLAYLSFTIPPTFIGTTTINFLPKTAVAADRILESVLRKATGYTVTIAQPSITPGVTIIPSAQSAQ